MRFIFYCMDFINFKFRRENAESSPIFKFYNGFFEFLVASDISQLMHNKHLFRVFCMHSNDGNYREKLMSTCRASKYGHYSRNICLYSYNSEYNGSCKMKMT